MANAGHAGIYIGNGLMSFFSPQTRYFNAGLGRIEFCVW